jgi:hypothetical protein
LRLSEEEFWSLDIQELHALIEQYNKNQERTDYRTALICSHILNLLPRDPKKKIKVFEPSDIFPQYSWGKESRESKKMTDEQMQDQIRLINAALGGQEIKRNGE